MHDELRAMMCALLTFDRLVPSQGMAYGTVHRTRAKGRVVEVEGAVFGAVPEGGVSTSYLEWRNATDRHCNAESAQDVPVQQRLRRQQELTSFTMYSYNFCWAMRTLRGKTAAGRWQRPTPAMAAGLADYVWYLDEWLTLPDAQR